MVPRFLLFFFLLSSMVQIAGGGLPPDVEQQHARWMAMLSPSARPKVSAAATEAAPLMFQKQTEAQLERSVQAIARRKFPGLEGKDVMAVVQLVIAEAYHQAVEDLKMQANKLKYQNRMKQRARTGLEAQGSVLSTTPRPTAAFREKSYAAAQRDSAVVAQQDRLDSVGDVSMEKQARLQNYMENHNRTAAMVSNVVRKIGRTNDSIIQNLK